MAQTALGVVTMSTHRAELVASPLTVREQYGEIYAGALTWNCYFKWALAVAGLIMVGLVLVIVRLQAQVAAIKPVFIRIDELGRHDVLTYAEATTPNPREHELRTALRTFVVAHFGRMRSVVARLSRVPVLSDADLQDEAIREAKKDIDASPASRLRKSKSSSGTKLIGCHTAPYRRGRLRQAVLSNRHTQIRRPDETYTLHLVRVGRCQPQRVSPDQPMGPAHHEVRLEQAFTQ